MTQEQHDRQLLETTWQTYNEEFADLVGAIVTPFDYVETREQVDWAARIFMFGYSLGALAGAGADTRTVSAAGTDKERVEGVVDTVVKLAESDAHPVSTERIRRDFLNDDQ